MQVRAPERAGEVYRAELDAAHTHGGLWISVWHPNISGRLARVRTVIDLLEDILDRGDVWLAPLREIAAHANECAERGTFDPRVVEIERAAGPKQRAERSEMRVTESTPIPARTGWSARLPAGQAFRVIDVEGGQAADLFAFNAEDTDEYLSAQHSRVADGANPARGRLDASSPTSAARSSSSSRTPRPGATTCWPRPATAGATSSSAAAPTTAPARRTSRPRPASTASRSPTRRSRSTSSPTSGSTRTTASSSRSA